MITWAIPQLLARSGRPGADHLPAQKEEVFAWIEEAKGLGIRSILCLLSREELHDYYEYVGIDLFKLYREAGFEVAYHPVSEDSSAAGISPEMYAAIAGDYRRMPKPLLVHCKVGVERTGAVIKFLARNPATL